MDRDVRCRGLAFELLAWRAACLTLTGRAVVRLASFPGYVPGLECGPRGSRAAVLRALERHFRVQHGL